MKKLKIKFLVATICSLTILSSCTKEYTIDEDHTNINQTEERYSLIDFLNSQIIRSHTKLSTSRITESIVLSHSEIIETRDGGIPMVLYRGIWNLFNHFDHEDTGFTSDGFLPLNGPLLISNELADNLGIEHDAFVEEGIYSATYDETAGYFNSITLQINW